MQILHQVQLLVRARIPRDNGDRRYVAATVMGIGIVLAGSVPALLGQVRKSPPSARDLFHRTTSTAMPGRESPGSGETNHVGVRYVLSINEGSSSRAVPTDHPFQSGDCVSIELRVNRDGYLYVLSEGSSGRWDPQFPEASSSAGVKQGFIRRDEAVRLPRAGCWEMRPPAGEERLFVFLSEEEKEVRRLLDTFRLSELSRETPARPAEPPTVLLANARKMLASRDLVIDRSRPGAAEAGEEGLATYAVAKPPRLFIEISLRHQ